MHDAVAMRRVERQREVAQNALHFGRRQRVFATHALGQRFAVHVLHDDVDERRIVGSTRRRDFAERVHGHDVRVAQARRHARFATETLAMLLGRRELVPQNLDRDQAMQRDVARKEHDAHSAASDLADDLELRAEVFDDLLVLPRRRTPLELAGNRHLERVSVGIDEERQGRHDD